MAQQTTGQRVIQQRMRMHVHNVQFVQLPLLAVEGGGLSFSFSAFDSALLEVSYADFGLVSV